jgi:segregation and condensation protein A
VVYGLHVPEQPVSEPATDTPPSGAEPGVVDAASAVPDASAIPDAVTVPGAGVLGAVAVPDAGVPGAVTVPDAGVPGAVAVAGGAVPEGGVPDSELPVTAEVDSGKFTVRLTNFTGPFDLLLQLIGKHKLDVTEIALHQVTDDFIAYIRAMGDDWDLGETSEFLLVAATLLDLKAARLLPSAEVEDEDDLALLEAGDLLFARLLQYKAYKEAAAVIADLEGIGARRWPRAVTLEPRYAEALPDLVLGFGPERLLKLALKQFLPKPPPPEVSIAHIHQVRVSVREHATLIRDRLRRAGSATFGLLIADCENTLEVVARFLALLELYREGLIDFEQPVSLEEMTVRWIGGDQVEGDLDIDDYEGTPPEPDTAAIDPDDINLDDLDSDDSPSSVDSSRDADEEDDDDDDLDDPDMVDVDYAALADAALGSGRGGPELDDEGEPVGADEAESEVSARDVTGSGIPESDVIGSGVSGSGVVGPDVTESGLSESDVAEPGVSGPGVSGPGVPESGGSGPDASGHDVSEPAVVEPDEGEPDAAGAGPERRDESGVTGTGMPGTGNHTADRASNDEEPS